MRWVFPEPIITQGANTVNGAHARHDEKPDLPELSPLELSVQGRKCITAQVGDASPQIYPEFFSDDYPFVANAASLKCQEPALNCLQKPYLSLTILGTQNHVSCYRTDALLMIRPM